MIAILHTNSILHEWQTGSFVCIGLGHGKYQFYNCIGHTVQQTCKLNSTPQLTHPPNEQTNIASISITFKTRRAVLSVPTNLLQWQKLRMQQPQI